MKNKIVEKVYEEKMMGEYNCAEMYEDLMTMLRLKVSPLGIKLLEKEEELASIKKVRVLKDGQYFTTCQLFGQAMSLGRTCAMTKGHIPLLNCEGINGMCPQDKVWHEGAAQAGIWYAEAEDSRERQKHTPYIPYGKYEAIVVSPLNSGKIDPDVCMIVGMPVQIFFLLSGYLRHDYQPIDTPFAGESSCSNHWVRTFLTGKPNISLPCYAEFRFGSYPEDCLIMTMKPEQLKKAIDGMKELAPMGMRYPVPGWGVMHGNGSVWGKGK